MEHVKALYNLHVAYQTEIDWLHRFCCVPRDYVKDAGEGGGGATILTADRSIKNNFHGYMPMHVERALFWVQCILFHNPTAKTLENHYETWIYIVCVIVCVSVIQGRWKRWTVPLVISGKPGIPGKLSGKNPESCICMRVSWVFRIVFRVFRN